VRWLLTVVLALLLAFGTAELLLRMTGHRPFEPLGGEWRGPIMHEPDAVLGWKAKPGCYRVPPFAPDGVPTEVTILPGGERRAGAQVARAGETVVLVGCSYVFGWGLSDADTLAWKLQARFPRSRIRNFGTAGYSTLQALLLLRRLFAEPDPPAHVIYGLVELHEARNMAAAWWARALASKAAEGYAAVPGCSLAPGNRLACRPPAAYPVWPLAAWSATITFLQDLVGMRQPRVLWGEPPQVTELLIVEMARLVQAAGSRFTVAVLEFSSATRTTRYLEFLRRADIDALDCTIPIPLEMRVAGDLHPNGDVNTRWAECVASALGG